MLFNFEYSPDVKDIIIPKMKGRASPISGGYALKRIYKDNDVVHSFIIHYVRQDTIHFITILFFSINYRVLIKISNKKLTFTFLSRD